MDSPLFLVGIALFFAGMFISKFLRWRATKLLSPQEKQDLLESWPRQSVFGGLPIFICLGFFFVGELHPKLIWLTYFTATALLTIYYLMVGRINSRWMGALGINPDFQRAFAKVHWMPFFGFVAFLSLVALASIL